MEWVGVNMPAAVQGFGQTIAKQLIYGTDPTFGSTNGFLGLHQYAKANSNVVHKLDGANASRSTLFAVRWDEFDGASIRIGTNDSGQLIGVRDLTLLIRLLPLLTPPPERESIDYKWLIEAFLALIIPSKTSVAAITQIDDSHLPTVLQVNNLIDAVDTGSGRIVLYGNSKVKNGLLI